MLRHALARPEQSKTQFPLFVRAGQEAAALWLGGAPLSAADWRDMRFRNLIAGLGLDDVSDRRVAFDDAFCRRIASSMVQGSPLALCAADGGCHE